MCKYIKPWLSPGDAIILAPLVLFCDNWTISQISHFTFPYPTICNIQNKNPHIFVFDGVLCDMGHVHCGIYENSLFIISSGLAWCHAPDLYLASNGHGRKIGCPTNLNGIRQNWIFSRGWEEGGSEASSTTAPPLRDGTGSSQHRATKYIEGKLFQFSTDWNQIWCAYWVIE